MFMFYCLLGAFLRRWYGGLFNNHRILGNRGLQTVCLILAFLSIFINDYTNIPQVITCIALTLWLQFQFWSRGHGEVADCGRHKYLSDDDIARYNDRWYHIPCDWILPNHKYEFLYDFIYLTLRYTCPMLVMALIDYRFIFIGLSIAPIYAFSMTLQEREAWLFNADNRWFHRGWDLAEYLAGAVVYGGSYLIW